MPKAGAIVVFANKREFGEFWIAILRAKAGMHVYISNFGRDNWAWPDCLARHTIAITEDVALYPYWERRDRDGYGREAQRRLRARPRTASRWYNLHEEFRETTNDIWIHRAGDELWWTLSSDEPPTDEIIEDPAPQFEARRIHIFHKPCSAWSNRNRSNVLLKWERIHPKARKFLAKQNTFQRLTPGNAAYAQALINGNPLSSWHDRPDWQADTRREPGWRGPI